MNNAVSRRGLLMALAMGHLFTAVPALADDAPKPPVRIVHAYPGGAVDVVARALADRLSATWKRPVIVETKPGANEILAADTVSKAPPDGSTIFLGTEATFANNPHLYKLPYDAATGLVPVTELLEIRFALITRADLPTPTLASFVELMRKNGDSYAYASPGVGSPLHLTMETFRQAANFPLTHVPYRVLPSALQDLMGGRVEAMFLGSSSAMPLVKAGKLRMLAMTGPSRLGDIPTFAELGHAALTESSFLGLALPKGASPDMVRSLHVDVQAIVRSDSFVKTLLTPNDFGPVASDPSEFVAKIATRKKTAGELIRSLNIKPE